MKELTIADLNTVVNHEPRVLDTRLAERLGYERPADIRPLIDRHAVALERLGGIIRTVRKNHKRGRPAAEFWLNKRQALFICTKSETERATDATIEMVSVFDEYLRGTLSPARTVQVRPYTRALPKPRPAKETLGREGLALIRIGDETVLVDTTRFRPGPDDQFVRIHHDGHISIGPIMAVEGYRHHGVREAAEEWRLTVQGEHGHTVGGRVRGYVQVLGTVISRMPAARPGRGDDRPKPAIARSPRTKAIPAAAAELRLMEVCGTA